MYDMHYDLLTILYYYFKRHEKLDRLDEYLPLLPQIYNKNNIRGGVINLYFAPIEEMVEELDISKYELQDIVTMLKKTTRLVENMKTLSLIEETTDFRIGIEGADFIRDENQLEQELYPLGVRFLTPVYKFQNQYGSGWNATGGLTEKGEKLIQKAIELGIAIDLSHANEETFYDILKLIKKEKEEGKEPIVIASHSNIRELCNRPRNLTREQLLKLKECNGYISLFTHGNFISLDSKNMTQEQKKQAFIEHLNYIIEETQFDPKKILLASDDMNFHPDPSYHNLEIFPLEKIKMQVENLLTPIYGKEFTEQIMYKNAQDLFQKIDLKELTIKSSTKSMRL